MSLHDQEENLDRMKAIGLVANDVADYIYFLGELMGSRDVVQMGRMGNLMPSPAFVEWASISTFDLETNLFLYCWIFN